MIKIAPSLLAADILHLERDAKRMLDAGADMLHVDVMDGHFVPNLSFGPSLVKGLRQAFSDADLDVHLMMSRPAMLLHEFMNCGASGVTVHAECEDDVSAMLRDIREAGCRAGLSVKPGTAVQTIAPLLSLCDLVLIMTVEPGFGGQAFMPDMTQKMVWLRQNGYSGHVQVDGGVNGLTALETIRAGADTLVMGTALYRAEDPGALMRALREGVGV